MQAARLHLPANAAGRDLVVGDIHGCYDELQALLRQADFDTAKDRLFSTGDLIDRGPNSADCIRLLEQPWFHAVRGNHEQMMLEAVDDFIAGRHLTLPMLMWASNGGSWVRGHTYAEVCDLVSLVDTLPMVITVGDDATQPLFGVLHAEWTSDANRLLAGDYDHADRAALLWGRDIVDGDAKAPELGFPVYVGHSIMLDPVSKGSLRYIDTGAFLRRSHSRGYLTMVEPATGRQWASVAQADALDWEAA